MKEPQFTFLFESVINLWGNDRSEILRPALEQVVKELEQIASYPLDSYQEPIFFL
jgi:hypothetical protein